MNGTVAAAIERLGDALHVRESTMGDVWTTSRLGIGPNACSWPGVLCTTPALYQPWSYNVSGISLPTWDDLYSGMDIPPVEIDAIYVSG